MKTTSSTQPFARVIDSQWANVGDNLKVRRALPAPQKNALGPWVFLDHFGPMATDPRGQGVPAHPHAGIETVTYLLEGGMAHRDSAGHEGRVEAGGAQWMTSGRGIVHAERPFDPDGNQTEKNFTLHGMQLWTSLPRALKMMPPRYQRISAAEIPIISKEGATVRVIAGESDGLRGPADVLMPLFLWHVALEPGGQWQGQTPAAMEAGVYVMAGEVAVDGNTTPLRVGQLGIVAQNAEAAVGSIAIRNDGEALAHIMLLGGAPAEGPLVFHGPFVMNSMEQIRYAEKAYMTGQMGSLESV
ncbi:MAG: pirin family protein [Burkholderiales bacterium]|nr:pirin family protein [Burkholderiales bacterium]